MKSACTHAVTTDLCTAILAPAIALAAAGCNVRKTEEGTLPEVNMEEGKLPEYEVATPEVNLDEKKIMPETIKAPDINRVNPEEKQGGNVEPDDAGVPSAATPASAGQ